MEKQKLLALADFFEHELEDSDVLMSNHCQCLIGHCADLWPERFTKGVNSGYRIPWPKMDGVDINQWNTSFLNFFGITSGQYDILFMETSRFTRLEAAEAVRFFVAYTEMTPEERALFWGGDKSFVQVVIAEAIDDYE